MALTKQDGIFNGSITAGNILITLVGKKNVCNGVICYDRENSSIPNGSLVASVALI